MKQTLHDLYLLCVRTWRDEHSFGRSAVIIVVLLLWFMGYSTMTMPIDPERQGTIVEYLARGVSIIYFAYSVIPLSFPVCYFIHKLRHKQKRRP